MPSPFLNSYLNTFKNAQYIALPLGYSWDCWIDIENWNAMKGNPSLMQKINKSIFYVIYRRVSSSFFNPYLGSGWGLQIYEASSLVAPIY